MPNSEEFNTGAILEKLSSLEKSRTEQFTLVHDSLGHLEQKFESFNSGIGFRVEKHDARITKMEVSLDILNKVAWLLFASSLTVVVAVFWKLVLK